MTNSSAEFFSFRTSYNDRHLWMCQISHAHMALTHVCPMCQKSSSWWSHPCLTHNLHHHSSSGYHNWRHQSQQKARILQLNLISSARQWLLTVMMNLKVVQKYHQAYMNGTDHYNRTSNKHSKTHLFEQQLTVWAKTGNKVLCKSKEWAKHLCRQMVPGRSLKHVADDKEPSVLDHVLLDCLRTFHQLTDKTQQLRTETA